MPRRVKAGVNVNIQIKDLWSAWNKSFNRQLCHFLFYLMKLIVHFKQKESIQEVGDCSIIRFQAFLSHLSTFDENETFH